MWRKARPEHCLCTDVRLPTPWDLGSRRSGYACHVCDRFYRGKGISTASKRLGRCRPQLHRPTESHSLSHSSPLLTLHCTRLEREVVGGLFCFNHPPPPQSPHLSYFGGGPYLPLQPSRPWTPLSPSVLYPGLHRAQDRSPQPHREGWGGGGSYSYSFLSRSIPRIRSASLEAGGGSTAMQTGLRLPRELVSSSGHCSFPWGCQTDPVDPP